ncbi:MULTISPECIES: peptidylprolyl isomerase [Brevibacterium]|uniref:Peptidyl-prolyl cis-trans isomerase n=1 Tax=Brevibacterium antiquum CNRZ 918 TaxID=1255637 RepID=A0A2H1IU56_9MICO|nr:MULTISPECIES: peptidylprolyl isomerase [Brevibacterium]SMX78757.1 peptidyl-prolyl cis-trans isomerase B (cyclophilin B) [Brevibacterium antiquum CNRZ 918]HCG56189.1 peptidylprolyl isomerase [Brevibacterium sp.]
MDHPARHRYRALTHRPVSAVAVLAVLAVLALLALTACGSAESADDSAGSNAGASESAGSSACQYPADSAPAAKDVEPPKESPQTSGKVAATVSTTAGDLSVSLDADGAPCTVNSFLSLADQKYFDDTDCHRLTTEGIFVLQCGDPSGTGSGGPGYTFADEVDGSEKYPAGTLAMANAGPDTNGSQFFVVYDDSSLPPDYTVFGSLDAASTKSVADIAAKGTESGASDGAPKEAVTITGVTVE